MKIYLSQFSEEEISAILSWTPNQKFLLEWAGPVYRFDTLREQLKKDLEFSLEYPDKFQMYSVVSVEDSQLIAHAQLSIDGQNSSAHISRVLIGNENLRGKGIGFQLIHHLLKIAFVKLKLNRVTLNVYDFNHSAILCYKKAGFKAEGLLKDNTKFKDVYWSTIPMAILKSEFPI
ncbi:GNAT family N-acetyltransferase [Leptospira perdikensis]|uniref:N-acetyltransferase n=1 Tax=Leptospira perdikensis TaxID=2484948 RepID=A0A4V3JNN8_9LEPT|nr:GNAT family protein [Leptospira perdikensis]TGL35790.1 N-acetyltransferase [Leptospira perdikensis]